MHNPQAIALDYLAAWNEREPAARRAQVAGIFAEESSYVDPLTRGAGIDGIDAMIGAAQQHFPAHRFALRGTPDGHNDVVRFAWTLHAPDGTPVAHGLDIATVTLDGRLADVTGFLDPA
ncbi:nuclear transport factor 2 family protein [Massilia sp. HP4]|uniref:nuclear transport factor 2 family protein n=1 Tax=Massilia sp. HP4 TaxID=2562316 RepID=UPI0010C1251C|nr:nuclear transport factor 2 family protein [Massilia sp. HP4]